MLRGPCTNVVLMSAIAYPENSPPRPRLWLWMALSLAVHIAAIATWQALPKSLAETEAGPAISLALRLEPAAAERPDTVSKRDAEPEPVAQPVTPPAPVNVVKSDPEPQSVPETKPVLRSPVETPVPVAINQPPPAVRPKPRERPAIPTRPAVTKSGAALPATQAASTERTVAARNAGAREASAAARPGLAALLRQAIEAQKRYPFTARRRGQQGTATVAFTLTPKGLIEAAEVDHSSGHRPLDQAALEAVQGIAPFGVAGEYLDAPVQFKLDIAFRLRQL